MMKRPLMNLVVGFGERNNLSGTIEQNCFGEFGDVFFTSFTLSMKWGVYANYHPDVYKKKELQLVTPF